LLFVVPGILLIVDNLDNEPMLWNETHRDVHPRPTSYDELRNRTYRYAAAIKAVDPGAKTLGPAEWGWNGYFYSALDWAVTGGTTPKTATATGASPGAVVPAADEGVRAE
jgi:hypothetical protein